MPGIALHQQLADLKANSAAVAAFTSVGMTPTAPEPICSFFQSCTVSIYVPPTPDDFNTFAQFGNAAYATRDSLFSESELGQYYTNLYYEHTGGVSSALLSDSDLFEMGAELIKEVMPGLQGMLGFSDVEVAVTPELIASVQSFLGSVSEATEPATAAAINDEQGRVNWEELQGKTFSEAWSYMVDTVQVP